MSFGLLYNSTSISKGSIKTEFGTHLNQKGDLGDKSNYTVCATLSQPVIASTCAIGGGIMEESSFRSILSNIFTSSKDKIFGPSEKEDK